MAVVAAAAEATEGEALVVLEANAKGPIGMSIVTNFGKIKHTYHLPFPDCIRHGFHERTEKSYSNGNF